jgi:V/A-type H+-transporting ATPase subunit I
MLSNDDLRRFYANPEAESNRILAEMEQLIEKLGELREAQTKQKDHMVAELQAAIEEENSRFNELIKELELEQSALTGKKDLMEETISRKVNGARVKLESVRSLEPEEIKSCFAVGVSDNELIPRLEEYLQRNPTIFHKVVRINQDKRFIFVFGSEERKKWVEALFLVFEVEDIFNVLDKEDILLVLDPNKRDEALKVYEKQLSKSLEEKESLSDQEKEIDLEIKKANEKIQTANNNNENKISELKEKYTNLMNQFEKDSAEKIFKAQQEQSVGISRIAYVDNVLKILSDKRAPVLRTNIISILQGWVPDYNVDKVKKIIRDVEASVGEKVYITFEDPSSDDHHIPNPEPKMPAILQPAWVLTYLRGWPSATELNPAYISIIVFSFQFGLMYGDIGQGLLFLIIGYYLWRKNKDIGRGMMYRLGGIMIPMGIAATIFGFMYDSFFLIEHGISHWLHDAHIHLPFHYPIMPNPVHETTTLMLWIFRIAAIEVIIGLLLGAYNQIKQGNPIGALGEHGLGMILYVIGLYMTALHFISIGMDFMGALGSPWFIVALVGMLFSFLEPVIHSVTHGHGIGMDSIGEGIGGLLMTFVEGLANLFSFLRIAAFAVAHASLAIAAEALTHSLGIAGVGLIIMNIVALSFEFVSSTVQSLRLLYYEFMGKFFHGEGVRFRPYTMRLAKKTEN